MIRKDRADHVYLTQGDKFEAIIADIRDCVARAQPVLVGTTSIETSEYLAGLLQKDDIAHNVLNAKQHEREAHIIAQAGRPGTVTIATNMAGRGTDIVLGGNLEAELHAPPEETDEHARAGVRAAWQERHNAVIGARGLHIIGTERHEARRVDNQLRGRSGRQGDPGSSRFYLPLQDDLLRIFGSQRVERIMERLGMQEGEPIEHKLVTRAIATAQKRVETHNFEIRKHLLEYDDVMNKQREVIYGMRRQILEGESQAETIAEWVDELVREAVKARFAERESELGLELLQALERHEMMIVLDTQWKDHLLSIDHLKEGIGLRGYGQRDPLTEYKKEAFDLFEDMFERVKAAVIERLFKVQIVRDAPMELPAMTAWADAREGRGALAGEPPRPAAPAPRAAAPPPTPTRRTPHRTYPRLSPPRHKYHNTPS